MRGVAENADSGRSVPALMGQDFLRTLLFVAPPGTVSPALAAAIEREFDWLSVKQVPDLGRACARFDSAVQLILVDIGYLADLEARYAQLRLAHPGATSALIGDLGQHSVETLVDTMEARRVRGIVPMDVNLDVLLSILRIMLRGGEYFPASLFKRQRIAESEPAARQHHERPPLPAAARSESMENLTERELEILVRVARGNQNKIIAGDLGLSEHTVKIHIHNIISKLGVHNRTEAAAVYLNSLNAGSGRNGRDERA